MNQKTIGIILIIVGIILAVVVQGLKAQEDRAINFIVHSQNGSCFLEDGTCLHGDRNLTPYIGGFILSAALVILGSYLVFFDKTQKILAKQHEEVSKALKEAKKHDSEKEKFHAFLQGFSQEEQSLLKAINEQEGILQSTLRYRTGMSKTALSLKLKEFEQKEIVSRKTEGKTNKVFLRKKF